MILQNYQMQMNYRIKLEIIDVCRKMVADGKDRESLYDVIKNNNNGNRQPNSIKDIQTADKILTILGGM